MFAPRVVLPALMIPSMHMIDPRSLLYLTYSSGCAENAPLLTASLSKLYPSDNFWSDIRRGATLGRDCGLS